MIATWAQLWSLRVLFFVSLVVLPCALAGSGFPAFAFAVAWGPNGPILSVVHARHSILPLLSRVR